MSEQHKRSVGEFIANNWVSWCIELIAMSAIAFYTISETRQTAEETRATLQRFEAAISQYAQKATGHIDQAAAASSQAIQEKATSLNRSDTEALIKAWKNSEETK